MLKRWSLANASAALRYSTTAIGANTPRPRCDVMSDDYDEIDDEEERLAEIEEGSMLMLTAPLPGAGRISA